MPDEIDLATLDDTPGSVVAGPATPPPGDTPAEPVASESPPAPETPVVDAPVAAEFDPDTVLKGLTPEQRSALLRKYTTEELAQHDFVSGKVGELTSKNLAAERARAAQIQRDTLAAQARENKDGDLAVQVLDADAQARESELHQGNWTTAEDTFKFLDADEATRPLLAGIAGKDYGKLSNGNGTLAALMFESDMARNVRTALPQYAAAIRTQAEADLREKITAELTTKIEADLRPVLEKDIRAKLNRAEPPPDTGSGGAPNGKASDMADHISAYGRGENLSPEIRQAVLVELGIKRN